MKIICVRCGKIVQLGREQTAVRGLCDECLTSMTKSARKDEGERTIILSQRSRCQGLEYGGKLYE